MTAETGARQTMACGCVVVVNLVANEFPDRDGTVLPFTTQTLVERLCDTHKRLIDSRSVGVSISGKFSP